MNETNNLNGKILNPLIDFDFIVNTELGLIRFIRNNFQDERAFKLDVLNKSDREILSLLYSRKNYNPLSVISTEENLHNIDELYESFFNTYKKEIISVSISEKKILDFVSAMLESGSNLGVHGYIAVNDDLEKYEMESHFNGMISFVYKKDKIGIKSKDPYYIRDYRFFTDNGICDISHKKIYMQPRQYTLDYFENTENDLTSNNMLILMGSDYKNKGENKNE